MERRFLADSRRWVGERVSGATLEVAVGTGANFEYYPTNIDLTGIDWSDAMLRHAQRKADRSGRAVTLLAADACALPFSDNSFDTVVATFSLCSIPDETAALQQMWRVLRPGGQLLLADHIAARGWPIRLIQRGIEIASIPIQGEYLTRRPLNTLQHLDIPILTSERHTLGMIERIHATKP